MVTVSLAVFAGMCFFLGGFVTCSVGIYCARGLLMRSAKWRERMDNFLDWCETNAEDYEDIDAP